MNKRDSVTEEELLEICSLPARFKTSGLGWVDLVGQSPYPAKQSRLDEDDLIEFLRANPNLIELWIVCSLDKRSTPSPFFRRSGSRYEVGYVESGGGTRASQFFDEAAPACAKFILQELAS